MLATDGDFNVGQTDDDDLKRLIENERKTRRLPVGVRLRPRQSQRPDDADASPRTATAPPPISTRSPRPRRCWSRMPRSTLFTDRQGREDPGRVQSGQGLGIPPDRLRDPGAQPRGFQQRPGRRRRDRLGPCGDRDLRDHAEGQRGDDDRRPALRPGDDRQWRRRRMRTNMPSSRSATRRRTATSRS